MKTTSLWIVALLALSMFNCNTKDSTSPEDQSSGALLINEILTSNDSTNADEFGEFDDWVELYNGTEEIIDVAGMYMTDDPLDPNPWLIPASVPSVTTIPPKGFLLLWCDKDPEQGAAHMDIKLSASGETVILFGPDMTTIIDSVQFGAMSAGVSYGRETDGALAWTLFTTPSPGSSN